MAIETLETTELTDIVLPFAKLMDGPSWITPTQDELSRLRGHYGAQEHNDFLSKEDPAMVFATAPRLPFSLALGLHPAAATRQIDTDALLETYAAYASLRPLFNVESYLGDPEKTRQRYQQERASRFLAATIVESALNNNHPYSQISGNRIENAIDHSKNLGLISRYTGKFIKRSVELVRS